MQFAESLTLFVLIHGKTLEDCRGELVGVPGIEFDAAVEHFGSPGKFGQQ
jgi:hypothetical protein